MFVEFLSGPWSVFLAFATFFFIIWPGYAVLQLLGFGLQRWPWALFAGPSVTLALWIISLSGAVWAKFTLQQIAIPIWIASGVLAVIGLVLAASSLRKGGDDKLASDPWLWLATGASVAIPLLVRPASFQFGLANFANSTAPDSWSFVAVADYLLTLPRGTEGGLSALHQYAAHLMGTRNASSAILGFLSIGLGGIEISQAIVLFCLIVLFANTAALMAFAATVFGRAGPAACVYVIIVGLGWPANIVLAGNFDQLLLLPLLPTTAVLALLAGRNFAAPRAGIVIGILTAAAFYAYVELSALGLLVAMSFIVPPNVPLRRFIGRAVPAICITLVVAVALTWTAFDPLLAMLKNQYSITGAAIRPGEGYFPGLVSQFDWPGALWALGPEYLLGPQFNISNVIGAALLLVTAAGAWFERKLWSAVLALAIVAAAFVDFTYREHYSYAAYKIISVNFWLIGFFAVAGFIWLAEFLPADRHWHRRVGIAASVGLLVIMGIRTAVARKVTHFSVNAIKQENFREIQRAAEIIRKEPTLLAVRDAFANEWAVYYLAETPMVIAPYRLYMAQAHVIPFMRRAKAVEPAAVRYIVTDRNDAIQNRVTGARRIWEGQAYSLWAVQEPSWTVIADFNDPNGVESDRHNMWAWLGGPPAEFIIVSARAVVAELAGMLYPGPRAPSGVDGIRVSLTDATGRHEIVIRQVSNRLPINLSVGETTVTITVEDPPKQNMPAGGDARPLILRMTDFIVQNARSQP